MNKVLTIPYGSYTEGVKIPAVFAKPLSRALFNALPLDADPQESAAVKVVVERGDAIDSILNQRQDVARIRDQLLQFQNCWGGMYDALNAGTRLGATAEKTSTKARSVIDKIFPDGVMFNRLEAPAAWAEGDRRYHRILELGIADDIVELIGRPYLDGVKKTTHALGDALGIGRVRREAPSKTALADSLFDFSRSVSRYTRLLAAKVIEDDAASVERFLAAVAPIDEYRSTRTTKTDEPDTDEPTPVTPTPVTPVSPVGPDGPFLDEPSNA